MLGYAQVCRIEASELRGCVEQIQPGKVALERTYGGHFFP